MRPETEDPAKAISDNPVSKQPRGEEPRPQSELTRVQPVAARRQPQDMDSPVAQPEPPAQPQPHDTEPSTQPEPAQPRAEGAQPPTQPTAGQPQPAATNNTNSSPPAAKGSKSSPMKLIIGGIIAILIMLLIVGGLSMRTSAESAAEEYTTSIGRYLNRYADAVSNARNAATAKRNVANLERPVFKEVLLGDQLSGAYVEAQEHSDGVSDRIDAANRDIERLANLEEFVQEYDDVVSDVYGLTSRMIAAGENRDIEGIVETLRSISDVYTDIQSLIEASELPAELDESKRSLGEAMNDQAMSVEAMIVALENEDEPAYFSAADDLSVAASDELAAQRGINELFRNINSELEDIAARLGGEGANREGANA